MPVSRLLLTSVLILVILLFAAPAAPQLLNSPYDGKIYLAGSAGFVFDRDTDINNPVTGPITDPEWEYDDVTSGSLALGYHLFGFRFEGEASLWSNDAELGGTLVEGEADYVSLMVNGYYDLPIFADILDLYLGAGIGATFADFEFDTIGFIGGGTSSGEDVWVVTYQAMAGLTLHVHEHVALTGGYRLRVFDEADYNGLVIDDDLIHSLEVGIRIRF